MGADAGTESNEYLSGKGIFSFSFFDNTAHSLTLMAATSSSHDNCSVTPFGSGIVGSQPRS